MKIVIRKVSLERGSHQYILESESESVFGFMIFLKEFIPLWVGEIQHILLITQKVVDQFFWFLGGIKTVQFWC